MVTRRAWNLVSEIGLDENTKDYKKRGVTLSNQIAAILLTASMVFLLILPEIKGFDNPYNIIFLSTLYAAILIFNGLKLTNASRVILSIVPTCILLGTLFFEDKIHTVAILFYSSPIAIFSIVPILIFDIKFEKALLYTSLLINLLGFLAIERVVFATQESTFILDFYREHYFIIKTVSLSYWSFIVLVLLFLTSYNKKYEIKINNTLALLAEKNDEVSLQLKEILAANEELRQQQEQIADQRDFIESKNTELKNYQEKLLDYVYQISESKDLLARKEAENYSLLMALRNNFIMVEFDIDGNIKWITPKTLEYLELDEKDILNKQSLEWIQKIDESDEVETMFGDIWKKIMDGESVSADMDLKVKNKTIHISATLAPIFDENNQITKVISLAEDVSDIILQKKQIIEINELLLDQQKEIKDQNEELQQQKEEIGAMNETLEERVKERTVVLEQKNKQLAEYAFINAHLLRSPVSSILGLINLLEYEKLNREERDIFGYLKKTVKQLDSIVFKINRAIQQNKEFDREFLKE